MFVSEFNVWVLAAHERYTAAKKLLEVSKNDPVTEPYASKYKARRIFAELIREMSKWKENGTLQARLLSMLFAYEMGVIDIETEECTSGCDVLTITLDSMQDISEKPESCLMALRIINKLGILWSERGDIEKALNYLLQGETLYSNYKSNCEACPFDFEDIFTMEKKVEDDWRPFEDTFTHTLYYLAQIYGNIDESEKSAKYCRQTLKRQKESGEDFTTNEWAMNCSTLSQYYIQNKLFYEARHLLSCAAHVLLKYEIEVEKTLTENNDAWMEVLRSKASLSFCWLKYCINLLSESEIGEESSEENPDICRLIDDEEVISIEKRIPCRVVTYDDAKTVFLFAQNHVSVAKSFYTLTTHASDYAQIVQDHSKLYKNLASCDSDLSRQCKMHKRRSDMLEDVLNQLNPQFYLSVCRQLQFELGEICHEMIDLKTKIASSSTEGLSIRATKKINSLLMKGIGHFQDFIATLKDKSGNFPEVFSDDIVRPALIAHFYIGRYYSKIKDTDVKKVQNLSKTEEYYSFIVKYTEKNPVHADSVENELPLIKEMLALLPEKMIHIVGSTLY